MRPSVRIAYLFILGLLGTTIAALIAALIRSGGGGQ